MARTATPDLDQQPPAALPSALAEVRQETVSDGHLAFLPCASGAVQQFVTDNLAEADEQGADV